METTVSEVLSEAASIYQNITEAQTQASNVDEALDVIEDVKESGAVKLENFTPVRAKLLGNLIKSVTGVDLLANNGIKFEDQGNEASAAIAEDKLNQASISFWEGLKQLFNSIWAKQKEWYIVISESVDVLIAKANKLREEAGRLSGKPKADQIDFKGFKNLVVNSGETIRANDTSQGLAVIDKLLTQTLSLRKVNEFESYIKTASKSLEAFSKAEKADQPDSSWVARFNNLFSPSVDIPTLPLTDEDLKQQAIYDPNNADYKTTKPFLGENVIIYSSLKPTSTLDMGHKMGLITAMMVSKQVDLTPDGDNKEDPEEVQTARKRFMVAVTLYPEQITAICDEAIKICEQVSFYEKAWARRDQFMGNTLDTLEKSVNEFKDRGETVTNAKEKIFNESNRAILAAIRRSNVFNSSVINLGVAASASALDYCAASIAQFEA